MNSICVFLGSSIGNHPAYMQAAGAMGRELAVRGLTCVYGGSCTGLMKQLADSALAAGGKVVGVTVQALKDKEGFLRNPHQKSIVRAKSSAELIDLLMKRGVSS